MLQEVLRQKELAQVKTTPVPVGPIDTHLTPQLRLQGIMWGIAQPKAIINRRIVAVGDTIENATVVAVSKDGVTVSFAGQEYLLKLPTKGGAGAGTQTSTWPNQQYGGQSF
ncbi:MAG: hypothetical protein NC910_02025 [Candidatus Omnitrophica bacterium]|nr:hypothetical protein [Candidatus Omnitrophota bacterium]